MQRIPRIEGSPAIMNQAAAHRELWSYLSRVHSILSEEDPRYAFYLTWLAEAASKAAHSQMGPDSLDSLKTRLDSTDPRSDEFDSELANEINEEVELEKYRFSVLYVLCKVFIELGEVRNAVEVLDDNQDEFKERPLYGVLRGEVLAQQETQESIDNAIQSAWRAREENPDWPETQKGLAAVITEALESDFEYQGYISEIPEDRESLLEEAKRSIEKALIAVTDHPEYLFIKGRVQILDDRFDTARHSLRQAIEHLNPNRPAYDRVLTRYRIELSNVDVQEQEYALRNETTRAVRQLEDLREDYKNASQQFQTRTLQFLGFFTGLIGIVIITAQVVISLDTTTAAIRLTLVLTGALLFSFGGFGFLLPNEGGDDIDIRVFGVLLCGSILMATGALL